MSFNPNIPLTGDFLAVSQKQILSNYQAIAQAWLENHVPLTAEKNVGMHEVLTLRPQSGDPATVNSQAVLYNKLVSGVPQLFFRSNLNQTPVQLSNEKLNTLQTGATKDAQSSFLAGPFTIYFGFFLDCPNNQIITLLPSSTLIYVGLSTMIPGGVSVGLSTTAVPINMNSNQFTVSFDTSANGFPSPKKPSIYYTAVGI